ncbi:28145_t:CDS:2 [Gigaspora margarita]|uniref:28145_t:CDS:1 n=1 Tax=Gigaspora margarita TaxID=4874 RepID=A0ABN7VJS6_GIGMA|nr:28145_t:CDS:2 [Gigaspora margarita]
MAEYSPLSTSEDQPSPQLQNKRESKINYIAIFFFLAVGVTLWTSIPSLIYLFNGTPEQSSQIEPSQTVPTPTITVPDSHPEMTKRIISVYFTSWSIYAREFNVKDLDVTKISHINYAFANLDSDGNVKLGDPWADTDKHFDGDSWNEEGNNLYGNWKQLGLLKKRNRHLKVLISIGGWTWSTNFPAVVANPSKRNIMVTSAIKMMYDLGADGIDIDWEYPSTESDANNYVTLCKEFRHEMDKYAEKIGEQNPFLLTVAVPCGPDQYKKLCLKDMSKYLDFFNLMSYDMSGSWSSVVGHQANLYGDDLSVDKAVTAYISRGVPSQKIVVGIPMYGRSFTNTNGIGHPFDGTGEGTWEKGVFDYKKLPPQNALEFFDDKIVASYSYDQIRKELITYDTPDIVRLKAKYVIDNNLRGVMNWEISSDFPTSHSRSLLSIEFDSLNGTECLDSTPNHIYYPDSVYDNVRNYFG